MFCTKSEISNHRNISNQVFIMFCMQCSCQMKEDFKDQRNHRIYLELKT
jgi:hypothetical protein